MVTMSQSTPLVDQSPGEAVVRGFLHRADSANGLVLTHGAGANCNSNLLTRLAEAFCSAGITVLRCDLPFRQQRPHGPPLGSAEKDQAGLRRAVQVLRALLGGRIFLGGHSYGGRMATMLAAQDPAVADGLLLLSYPLHPPRKPGQLRTAHFQSLQTRALFVHGERDPFGSTQEIVAALSLIPAETDLFSVEGAGHELLTKSNPERLLQGIVGHSRAFLLN
jgi:predicted alpha/beta-hydrolase family hydrolase